ncbi:MAG: hypothetical protein JW795_19430 [Chitinivibrionales bacterium]|nr:hypothetical protein [Chitinivibrionales bacterium]
MPSFRQWINLISAKNRITIDYQPLDFFVDKLRHSTPFSFSRFGDGEWSAILGQIGANCDGHRYSVELRKSLIESLVMPKSYYYSMQPFAIKSHGRKIGAFIKKHNIRLHWYNASVLHDANVSGTLFPFIDQLRRMSVIVIGPRHLRGLDKELFSYREFIEIPTVNCFNAFDTTVEQIEETSRRIPDGVYLFSASMAANCLIHRVYDSLGSSCWLLDIGSLWDIYLGVKSRSVYEDRSWSSLIDANLGRK